MEVLEHQREALAEIVARARAFFSGDWRELPDPTQVGVTKVLTNRSVLEQFAAVQMLDVHLSTTDECETVLTRHTQPEKDLLLLLDQLKLKLP